MPATADNPLLVDLYTLVDLIPGRVYVVSADHRILIANRAACEYVGRDPTGEVCHAALADSPEPCELCTLDRVLAGETITMEGPDDPPDRWQRVHHQPMRLADGSVAKLTIVADVTKEHLTEQALAASEDKYRKIFDAVDDGLAIHDGETGDYLEVNLRLQEMSGRPWEGRVPLSAIPSPPPFTAERAEALFRKAAAGQTQRFEWLANRPDGSEIWHEITLRPLELNGHKRVVAVVRDVTRRKQVELKLRKSEDRHRQLLANLDDTVFSLSPDGTFTYVTDQITRFSGFAKDEVIGSSFANFVIEEDLPRLASEFQRCLAGEHIATEFGVRVKDGSVRIVRTSSRPVYEGDRVVGASGVMTDLTDLRRTEQEKRSLEEQLRQSQKMEALGRLAGGVAHDFNNLLFVILNHAQFVRLELPDDAPARASARQIEQAADRASELTRTLLEFARRKPAMRKVIDLNAVLAEMEDMLRRIVGEDIQLRTLRAENLARVEADPSHISQVLMNLVANARDAMPDGGRLQIETADVDVDRAQARTRLGLEPGDYVTLTVTDSGCGMDTEARDRAFEPFYTTKPGGQSTGLGLSTVYSAVRQTGGRVEIESTPGQGTTVRVYLPATDQWPTTTPVRDLLRLPDIKGKTVLLVEDQTSVRELVAGMLEELGAELLQADDGQHALALARSYDGEIHLLMTDVLMPGMKGWELADKLCAQRPAMRVLYMSGWIGDDASPDLGGREAPLLLKPFRSRDLLFKLHEALQDPP